MKILVIEDDQNVSAYIAKGLKEAGHVVDQSDNGKDGLFLAQSEKYDVLVIDRMLPEIDGLTVIQTLRGSGFVVPILILSALADINDRVKGLRSGGDDYLTKPFAFAELLARVEILGRRNMTTTDSKDTILKTADIELNLLKRNVRKGQETIDLQTREFNLLEFLLRHKGQVVTRTLLLEAVWDYHFDPQTNVIDVHISRLRKKIHDHDGTIIKTVRGAGYIIEDSF
ncbi:MAG: winged helix-turn-helix domain-containing protein [Alphaproteobacteria bacterium]